MRHSASVSSLWASNAYWRLLLAETIWINSDFKEWIANYMHTNLCVYLGIENHMYGQIADTRDRWHLHVLNACKMCQSIWLLQMTCKRQPSLTFHYSTYTHTYTYIHLYGWIFSCNLDCSFILVFNWRKLVWKHIRTVVVFYVDFKTSDSPVNW